MLSTDQMRAIVFLKLPCSGPDHGEHYTVADTSLAGRYCKGCVDELARMLGDAYDAGRAHYVNEARSVT